MRKAIHEIINQAIKLPRAESIEFLRNHDSKPLRMVLRLIYDTDVKMLLPNTKPPHYKPHDDVGYEMMLYNEVRRLRIFIEGGGYDTNLPSYKREGLFIGILEGIANGDAELLIHALSRKPLKGLTQKQVLEAFPDLFSTSFV